MSIVVLNASREVIGTTSLRRAVNMLVSGAAVGVALADNDAHVVTSASGRAVQVPPMIALSEYVHVPFRRPSPTKANVLARDEHTCQYGRCTRRATTVDHVLPRSRGGDNSWQNLVAACVRCNNAKGNRTPKEWGRKLKQRPEALTWAVMVVLRQRLPMAEVARVAAL